MINLIVSSKYYIVINYVCLVKTVKENTVRELNLVPTILN